MWSFPSPPHPQIIAFGWDGQTWPSSLLRLGLSILLDSCGRWLSFFPLEQVPSSHPVFMKPASSQCHKNKDPEKCWLLSNNLCVFEYVFNIDLIWYKISIRSISEWHAHKFLLLLRLYGFSITFIDTHSNIFHLEVMAFCKCFRSHFIKHGYNKNKTVFHQENKLFTFWFQSYQTD